MEIKEALLPQIKPLSLQWTRNLEGKTKEDFEIIIRNSTLLLTRLKEIIEEEERTILLNSTSEKDFEDPNWSHKTAYRNGRLSALKTMKLLIPF